MNGVVKCDHNCARLLPRSPYFVDKSGVEHICQAGGVAVENTIMIVHVFEQFSQPFGSGGIGGVIELFVADAGRIFEQKRRLATNFFVKELKQFILNAATV